MPTLDAEHAAQTLPEEERVRYLCAVASLAGVDGEVAPSERKRIAGLCAALGVDGDGRDRVLAAALRTDPEQLAAELALVRIDPALSQQLLIDSLVLAFADGHVVSVESERLSALAERLGVNLAQVVLLGRYVEMTLSRDPAPGAAGAAPGGAGDDHHLVAELVAGLRDAAEHERARRGIRWLYHRLVGR